MALVPISYNLRSLFVRRGATLLTALGLGATVAVVAGVLALQQGFETLFTEAGREDVLVLLRPGSTHETDSHFSVETADQLVKTLPEIAEGEDGQPLASGELYLGVRLHKTSGGETNVPIRGVEQRTFDVHQGVVSVIEGRRLGQGSDEIMVGRKLVGRIRDCRIGGVIQINVTPFRVVGVFDSTGPYASEIWGDVQRIGEALKRPAYSRVIAVARPGADLEALAERLKNDKQTPTNVMTEREFLKAQTGMLSTTLYGLVSFLAVVMGVAAVFTATNTMLAALAARTHEIGILLSLGFRPFPIFLSFLFEALVLGLLGGVAGCLLALPINGIETGTTNWDTFTEVAFAFRITPRVLATAVFYALVLGLLGGAWPAWRAARMSPTRAMRRG